MTDNLLPPNSTELDQALQAATRYNLSPAVLKTLHIPEEIPAPLLPWLAWGENVPTWPDDEKARREIINRSHKLHSLIGTASGLRAAARWTGAEVTRITAPPSKTFLGGWTEQSRKDWLAAMPQLRVYPRRGRSLNTSFTLGHSYLGQNPHKSDAVFRSTARTAIYYPNGQVEELTTQEWQSGTATGNAVLTAARHSNSFGLHLGTLSSNFLAAGSASNRLFRLDQTQYRYNTATLQIKTLAPTLEPLNLDVEIIGERAPRPAAFLLGLPTGGSYLCKLDTEKRFYRRSYLHDPNVNATAKNGPSYLGATRLSMPPFHIEARLKIPESHSHSAHVGDYIGGNKPTARNAQARLEQPLKNLAWMRAEADKVSIDTRHTRAVIARQYLKAGSVIAGQIIDR